MREISQDFPSYATALSRVQVCIFVCCFFVKHLHTTHRNNVKTNETFEEELNSWQMRTQAPQSALVFNIVSKRKEEEKTYSRSLS
jgi:hypothetical protein